MILYRLLIPNCKSSMRILSMVLKNKICQKDQLYTWNVLGIWELQDWTGSCLCVLAVHEKVREAEMYKVILVQKAIYYKPNINKTYGRVRIHYLIWSRYHGIWSHHFMENRWKNSGNSDKLHFWGAPKINADGDYSHEIKRLLLLGIKVMTKLDSVLKSRDIIICHQSSM